MPDINLTHKWSHRDNWIGNIKWFDHSVRVRIHRSNQQLVCEQQQQFLSTLQTDIPYWDNHFRQFAAKQYIESIHNLTANQTQITQQKQAISQLVSHLSIREIETIHTSYTVTLDNDHHLFTDHSLRIEGTLQQQSITTRLINIREQYNTIIDTMQTNPTDPIQAIERLINLYPDAINSYHHDIADSIPLFVIDWGDDTICTYLNIMKETTSDTTLQLEFNYWIQAIEAKIEAKIEAENEH
ncbi:hypothetical protein [Paenibacillus wenxiniae]|uniref:DUF3885 domain-containing protein n=1 Tax=Paenibacillus wenxiniae TaxID=1636843 RepID=A0ABW4RG60_9BACL